MIRKRAAKKGGKPVKPTFAPAICMDHDNKEYFNQVELPGVEKEDVEL